MVSGVLPVPPTETLPITITGTGSLWLRNIPLRNSLRRRETADA